jgi:hypothetical protein
MLMRCRNRDSGFRDCCEAQHFGLRVERGCGRGRSFVVEFVTVSQVRSATCAWKSIDVDFNR